MKDQAMTEFDSAPDAQTHRLSVLGITSAVVAVVGFFVPITSLRLLVGVVAAILGHAALNEIKRGLKSGKSWATAGLGLGYLLVVLSIIAVVGGN